MKLWKSFTTRNQEVKGFQKILMLIFENQSQLQKGEKFGQKFL